MPEYFERKMFDTIVLRNQILIDAHADEEMYRMTILFLQHAIQDPAQLVGLICNPSAAVGLMQLCVLAVAKEYKHLYADHLIDDDDDA